MREHRHEMLIASLQCATATRCLEGREPGWEPVCAHCGKDLGGYAGSVVFKRGKPMSLCPEHRGADVGDEIIEYYLTPEEARKIRERDARMDRFVESLVYGIRKYKEETLARVWAGD